ncbi:MAG TPA: SGNH/GDSL hydrolase family protein [Polyangiaceae bacterium]|jgi:lysophospholipase L1-like esterase
MIRSLSFALFVAGVGSAVVLASCTEHDSNGNPHHPSTAGNGGSAGEAGANEGDAGKGGGSGGASGSAGTAGSGGEAGGTVVPPVPMTAVDADDPNIVYSGRVDFTAPKAPKFSLSGVAISANFHGTAANLKLTDQYRYGKWVNFFDVSIDGGPATRVMAKAATTTATFSVAAGLADADHTIRVVKRTEANVGFSQFNGFEFGSPSNGGKILPKTDPPTRKIEFIGDSITCGSGDEGKGGSDPQCTQSLADVLATDGMGQPAENAAQSYGPLLAASLNAEYHLTAYSGIGLVQNYSNMYDARTMPDLYDLLLPEETSTTTIPGESASAIWPVANWVPDVIVIALGTNDFGGGDGTQTFAIDSTFVNTTFPQKYESFIDTLHTDYPNAVFAITSSPILADYPDLDLSLAAVVNYYGGADGAAGPKVARCDFSHLPSGGGGCTGHPTLAQQATMATEIESCVKTLAGW